MNICVFGLGYVGCTVVGCLASQGHRIRGIDPNQLKVDAINAGVSPIVEPQLVDLIETARARGMLLANRTCDDLSDVDLVLVCVGTPTGEQGNHDMRYVVAVTQELAKLLQPARRRPLTIAFRSTMRPGTMANLIYPILANQLSADTLGQISLVYNPEFLRESTAVADFFAPPKIVIGTRDGEPNAMLTALNQGIDAPSFVTPWAEAELTKFVDNSWHAFKVTFANEIGRICRSSGLDARIVHAIFASDHKLNLSAYYTRPGGPFGGSCLPKDVRALAALADELRVDTPMIAHVMASNAAHKAFLAETALSRLTPQSDVILSGLAFKARTDDLRESPNVYLARRLLEAGHRLRIFDPAISTEHLVGQNLGFAYSQLPSLDSLLITREDAGKTRFDLAIRTNSTFDELGPLDVPVLDFDRL